MFLRPLFSLQHEFISKLACLSAEKPPLKSISSLSLSLREAEHLLQRNRRLNLSAQTPRRCRIKFTNSFAEWKSTRGQHEIACEWKEMSLIYRCKYCWTWPKEGYFSLLIRQMVFIITCVRVRRPAHKKPQFVPPHQTINNPFSVSKKTVSHHYGCCKWLITISSSAPSLGELNLEVPVLPFIM